MIEVILFFFFLLVTLYSGFVFSSYFLREKRVFILVPLAILLGLNGYNFLVNVGSYFIPINANVWVSIIFLLIFSVTTFFYNRNKKDGGAYTPLVSAFSTKQYSLLFGLAIMISLFSGIVAVKSLALDDLFVGHLPLAKTITEGNFPVVDPTAPEHRLSYHYGADLFTASINIITGIPLWLGYDIQIFFFSGALFLILFAFAYEITKSYWAGIVASFLFLYGTGLQWVYFFTTGVPALWKTYIAREYLDAPWRFLADVAFPKLNTSYIHSMHNHSTAMGTPMLILALWLYFKSLNEEDNKKSIIYILISSVCYGYVALSLETYFMISLLAFIALFIIKFIDVWYKKAGDIFSAVRMKRFLLNTLVFVFVGLGIAVLQGGVIASLFSDSDRESIVVVKNFEEFMTLDLAPRVAPQSEITIPPENTSGPVIRLFSLDFFIQFGLSIFLIIPALFYFIKKQYTEVVLLGIMAIGAFIVPFIFRWPTRNWEMSRFFLIAIPIFSFICGLFLVRLHEKSASKLKNYLIWGLIILLCLSGVLSQAIFSVSNLDRFGQIGPLFMRPPMASAVDNLLYAWIDKNTTQSDRFFPYSENFIRHTGRYTPGAPYHFTFSQRKVERLWYNKIIKDCSLEAVNFFSINYFYVKSNFPIKNATDCFKKLKAEKVFEITLDNEYGSIYKIK